MNVSVMDLYDLCQRCQVWIPKSEVNALKIEKVTLCKTCNELIQKLPKTSADVQRQLLKCSSCENCVTPNQMISCMIEVDYNDYRAEYYCSQECVIKVLSTK